MKIFVLSLLLVSIAISSVSTITEDDLAVELEANRQIWLVYRSQSSSNDVIQKVNRVLKGFFRVALIASDADKLSLYGDDRSAPIDYSQELSSDQIVAWALSELDKIIAVRSLEAKALKDFQQFQQKQIQRANKEWKDEQQLRKKSNTILLQNDNWQSVFLNSREPFLINFYQSNNSACISLNKDWQLVSTELKGKVRVAKINITQSQNHKLEEQLKLVKYPSVRFYKNGPKKVDQFAQYQGIHKKTSILQWVNTRLTQKATEASIETLTKQSYERLCKTTKNTCIIVFLDGSQPENTLSSIQKLALSHISKPITFLISQKGQQDNFAKQVGVTSYPNTVMMYCKLKKVWNMGDLNLQNIEQGINEISLGNRNNFVRVAFTEDLQ